MAKDYVVLKKQHDKIRSTFERITPPQPDDEFETLRRSTLNEMDKMEKYLIGRVTGEGSMQAPAVAEVD